MTTITENCTENVLNPYHTAVICTNARVKQIIINLNGDIKRRVTSV